jgi:DNA-binding GntR family transcriptional regulator
MNARAHAAAEDQPLYEVIYRVLRRHIDDELLPKGLVLSEAAVARVFQSSRAPAGAALRRLKTEGFLKSFAGRGLLIGGGDGREPFRLDLIEAGLTPPETETLDPRARNRRVKIYPEVEHIISSSIAYGRFQLNESLLAEYYKVSRTVAHEVLAQLDRIGLVSQDRNRRWYAGPLRPQSMSQHFELRWLLEPVALDQAFPFLDRNHLVAKIEGIRSLQRGHRTTAKIEELERDLHVDTVLKCSNARLKDAIIRSQLPLIAMHDTFQSHLDTKEIDMMLAEHLTIFEHLIAAEPQKAGRALERHLKRSVVSNLRRLGALGALPEARRVPFLVPID